MADYKKSLYNVSLGGQGFLLKGTPSNPARAVVQAPIFGNRFASGDRDYTDFTFWWYLAQKDWSAGIKNEISWMDDAKYYFSTNLDVFKEYGTIKLGLIQELKTTLTEDILCGEEGEITPRPQSTALRSPASNKIIDGFGAYAWTDPANAYSSNNVYATAEQGDQKIHCWYNFSIPAIPATATILGIEVLVEVKATDPSSLSPKLSVSLTKNKNDVAGVGKNTAVLTTSDVVYTLGSVNDLWGTTWDYDDFGTDFGVTFVSGTVSTTPTTTDYSLDHIQIRVYYRVPGVDTTYYVGTDEDAGGKPVVYQWASPNWDNITDTQMTATRTEITQTFFKSGIFWILTTGTSNLNAVLSWDGTSFTDHTTNIKNGASLDGAVQNAYCCCESGDYFYVAINNSTLKYSAIVKTSEPVPAEGDWTKVLERYTNSLIVDICSFNGLIYYLLYEEPFCELRVYDPADEADVEVFVFKNALISPAGLARKLLINFRNSLIITIPPDEIWELKDGNLQRILKRSDGKETLLLTNDETDFYLSKGGVVSDNKVFWGNLVYDGTYLSNWIKPISDDGTESYYPLFTDKSDKIWGVDTENQKKAYRQAATYKTGLVTKNFLLFSELDTIATIDKLFDKVHIIFGALEENQKIQLWYSVNGGVSWSDLGSVSYTVDGGTITTKTFAFPENTITKKIMMKVGLEDTSGSDTPTFRDISVAYYPLPHYKQRWDLILNCIDGLMLLDGKTHEAKRGEELRNILKAFWKNRDSLEFQDVDFTETLINDEDGITAADVTITVDSTADFPEQGIIRIENEKIKYTGKTAIAFTGCTRGYEGTVRTTHDDDTVVSNSHKVILTNYQESTSVGTEPKIDEFLVRVELTEI